MNIFTFVVLFHWLIAIDFCGAVILCRIAKHKKGKFIVVAFIWVAFDTFTLIPDNKLIKIMLNEWRCMMFTRLCIYFRFLRFDKITSHRWLNINTVKQWKQSFLLPIAVSLTAFIISWRFGKKNGILLRIFSAYFSANANWTFRKK